jgi:hypothetical protein
MSSEYTVSDIVDFINSRYPNKISHTYTNSDGTFDIFIKDFDFYNSKEFRMLVGDIYSEYCQDALTGINFLASIPLGVEQSSNSKVDHPSHYTQHPSGVECISITEHMNFCVGNAIKYLWRNGLKDQESDIEDLEKAKWYIEREIQRRKNAKV